MHGTACCIIHQRSLSTRFFRVCHFIGGLNHMCISASSLLGSSTITSTACDLCQAKTCVTSNGEIIQGGLVLGLLFS
jgi:hypothetical protein